MPRQKSSPAYARMIAHSENLWHVTGDRRGAQFLSPFASAHTREALIEDAMSIPEYAPTRDAKGEIVWGEPRFWSREKAARAVDALGPSPRILVEPAEHAA